MGTYIDPNGNKALSVNREPDGSFTFKITHVVDGKAGMTQSAHISPRDMDGIRQDIGCGRQLSRTEVTLIAAQFNGGDTSDSKVIDDNTYDLRVHFETYPNARRFIETIDGRVRFAQMLSYESTDDDLEIQVICEREISE